MKIGEIGVGRGFPPFVVAEMSGNHNGSYDRALRIVDAAAGAGVGALKLQTYTADTMTLDVDRPGFVISEPTSIWRGRRLHELYEAAHTPWEWHESIMQRAHERGLLCFSSPFDLTAVSFLEDLNIPCYKVASPEIVDHPLIEAVAATGKPLIISTGAATLLEVDEAVEVARRAGCRDLVLLQCTSSYPSSPDDANLRAIPALRDRYGCEVGLSDHSLGVGVSVAAVALGATVIEKHLVEDRTSGGVDAPFSMEPLEMESLVRESERAWRALGTHVVSPRPSEAGARSRRRSIYITADLSAGDELSADNIRVVRPGGGLHPKHLTGIMGRRLSRDVAAGTPVDWGMLERDELGDATTGFAPEP
jgi:N-acetylneuraminate synthase